MLEFKRVLKAASVFGLLLAAFLSSTIFSAPLAGKPDKVVDDETVYVLLDAEGTVKKTIVVDWLRLQGKGLVEVVDKGDVNQVEALKEDLKPEIKGDRIVWRVEANGLRDFYYRADTKKELPLKVKINYFLNGNQVEPTELAGKSGHLKLEITVENKLKKKVKVPYLGADGRNFKEKLEEIFVPLLAVVNLDLKASKFRNVEAEDANLSVSGETMKYSWMLFPQGVEEVSIEMDADNIELPPLIISAFPQMPREESLDIEDKFRELRDGLAGLSQLPAAHMEVLNGLINELDFSQYEEMAEAFDQFDLFVEGISETRQGVDNLVDLTEGQIEALNGIIDGIDGLIELLDSQIAILEGLGISNDSLTTLAQERAAFYPGDTTLALLAEGLAQQGGMITTLTTGGMVGGTYLPGLKETRDGLKGIKDSLVALRDGGALGGVELPGLKTTSAGLAGISAGLAEMEAGLTDMEDEIGKVESLPEALKELRDTLVALKDGGSFMGQFLPGLNETREALDVVVDSLEDGLEEIRVGEALINVMKKEAENYDTFLGKPDGAEGRVRFIFKTEAIEKG